MYGEVLDPLPVSSKGEVRYEWPIRLEDGRIVILPDDGNLIEKLTRLRNQWQRPFHVEIECISKKFYVVRADTDKPVRATAA